MLSVISTGTELRRFRRGLLPRLAVAAMILVPLLYGALYLWAFWDPTGNLDKLPVALVDADAGATVSGTAEHAGADVVDKLTASKALDWHVTTADDAATGVRDGRYYFAVTIPASFSSDLASAGGAHPTSASIQVTYDDANSFLATTLGRTAMLQVEQAVSSAAGQQAVSQVLVGLGSARDGFATASDGALTLKAAAGDLSAGAHQVAAGASTAASGATSLASGTAQVASGAASLASGASSLASGAGALKAGTAQVATGASQLASAVQAAKPGADQLSAGAAAVSSGVDTAVSQVTAMSSKLSSLSSVAAYLAGQAYNADGSIKDPAAAQQLGTLAAAVPSASAGAAMAQQLATLQDGAHQVAAGAAQADQGTATLASSSAQLATGAASAASGAASLADGASSLSAGAATLASGAASAASGASDLAHGAATLASGAAAVADGAGQVTDGTGRLSSALSGGAAAIPADDAAQQTARATAIATPVTLHDTDLAKAQGFGEGFAPFFIPLALFVGSLITWLLLRPLPSRALAAAVPGWRTTIAGFLPALLLGLAQVAVMLGVIHYGVGLHLSNAAGTVAFTVLVVATFLALQQMLIALLGPAAGKVAVLALLMLQLASSGGTYPVDTTPAFFRAIHPWMPMSYAVTGLRMLITGGADGRLVVSIVVLVGTLVASLAVSSWRAGRMRTWTLSRLHPALSI